MSDERLHQRAKELIDANRKEIDARIAEALALGEDTFDPPLVVLTWVGAYHEATWQLWQEVQA